MTFLEKLQCSFPEERLIIFIGWDKIFIGWDKIFIGWDKIFIGWDKRLFVFIGVKVEIAFYSDIFSF